MVSIKDAFLTTSVSFHSLEVGDVFRHPENYHTYIVGSKTSNRLGVLSYPKKDTAYFSDIHCEFLYITSDLLNSEDIKFSKKYLKY